MEILDSYEVAVQMAEADGVTAHELAKRVGSPFPARMKDILNRCDGLERTSEIRGSGHVYRVKSVEEKESYTEEDILAFLPLDSNEKLANFFCFIAQALRDKSSQ